MIYIPTTIWKWYVGMPIPKISSMLPKPPASAELWAKQFNCADNFVKIVEIIEEIPITIPAIAGVKNFTWDFIEAITSAIKSFRRSSTRWISLIYLDIDNKACAAI